MLPQQADPVLSEMLYAMAQAPKIVQPSKFWERLNQQHVQMLDLENFKRTLALEYFTFLCSKKDHQIRFLEKKCSSTSKLYHKMRTKLTRSFPELKGENSTNYIYLTRLLWHYVVRQLPKQELQLDEPLVGSPFLIKWRNRAVTQDLANSLLEYHAVTQKTGCDIKSILELGAGYGRLAYVFLRKMPRCKYLISDIPPALFVSQSYLSSVFPDKKVMRYRPFNTFSEIEEEYAQAELCFFLPHQLEMLPDKSIELGINISSLHEMRHEQIAYYFSQFSRLLSKHFYFKQWKNSILPYENITIKENDYPIPAAWRQIFWQTCPVQTAFFEALFAT